MISRWAGSSSTISILPMPGSPRYREMEFRSAVASVPRKYFASMLFDYPPHQSKSQAHPPGTFGIIRFENQVQVLGNNARPLIGNRTGDGSVPFRPLGRKTDGGSRRHYVYAVQ